jgi:PhzF family phenazine biosynthesis protein
MSVAAHQIVTFAGEPFRGNPAFAVALERPLPDTTQFKLCAQLHEDVLAVLTGRGPDIELRFVTQRAVHPGAGHATHAAAWVALNRLCPGTRELSFRLANGGHRPVRCDGEIIAVDWPIMPFSAVDEIDALEQALGHRPERTFSSSFGTIALYPFAEDVAALAPDLGRVVELGANTVIVTAPASRSDFVVRVFAPKLGLPEDPVCGTAHRIIVPYWAQRLGRTSLVSHQLSPRTGELFCELRGDVVTIAGLAAPFLEGVIRLPVSDDDHHQ